MTLLNEHIPLEQGLRLVIVGHVVGQQPLNEHIPLEQGLRLNFVFTVIKTEELNEHIPLEQGLRLCSVSLHGGTAYSMSIFH